MGVVKNGLVVGGCGVANSKRWWLWIGLVSLVVVGLLLVWVDWFVCLFLVFLWLVGSVDDFGLG